MFASSNTLPLTLLMSLCHSLLQVLLSSSSSTCFSPSLPPYTLLVTITSPSFASSVPLLPFPSHSLLTSPSLPLLCPSFLPHDGFLGESVLNKRAARCRKAGERGRARGAKPIFFSTLRTQHTSHTATYSPCPGSDSRDTLSCAVFDAT